MSQKVRVGPPHTKGPDLDFSRKPVLVFWETTRACSLSCIHCRASAITDPLPNELTHSEAMSLIEQITKFDKPYPTMIFTGGDPLKRTDLFDLMLHTAELGINFAVSPAVTELLTYETLVRFKRIGAASISVSLDGAYEDTHDAIRRRKGTFQRTLESIKDAVSLGLNIQVNTAIMQGNLEELPELFHLIKNLGVRTWEVFFLIKVGRGSSVEDLNPAQCESACNFLLDASSYGVTIRTVEAPFIRRVIRQRSEPGSSWNDLDYQRLASRLVQLEGEPRSTSTLRPRGTLDGDGIVFVAHDGTIHPGGLLPIPLGNIKTDSLANIYSESKLLGNIRNRKMSGGCGVCEFSKACGGSRARAFSYSADPLSSDPACIHASLMYD